MKQKTQLLLFLALSAVAAAVWYYVFHPGSMAGEAGSVEIASEKLGVDNPQLHRWKIAAARKTVYGSSKRNIFSASMPAPQFHTKKIAVVQPPPQPVPQLPPPPSVPVVAPLPLKFFGYASAASRGPHRAFFTDGEQVYVIAEGELLLGRFRVVRIEKNRIEYEELATGLRGSAPLEPQGPPS